MVSAMTWVENIETWEDSGANRWENVLARMLGNNPGRIGVEAAALPPVVRNWFDDAMPGIDLTNISALLGEMRMIKSPEEVQVMRQAGEIAGAMMQAAEDSPVRARQPDSLQLGVGKPSYRR